MEPTELMMMMMMMTLRLLFCCLCRYALDEFATARRAAVVRCFIDALTRGGPAGTPRPIELHSHDPLRYLGDMLAWLHQAAASEHEHILALLKCCSKIGKSEYISFIMQLY